MRKFVTEPANWLKALVLLVSVLLAGSLMTRADAPIVTSAVAAEPAVVAPGPIIDLVRIKNSPGGSVSIFLALRERLRASGARIEIEGYCASACTMLLDLPNVCAFPGARFGFHLPFYMRPDLEGIRQYESNLDKVLFLQFYPKKIRDWITAHGGLTVDLLWLKGKDLRALVPTCSPAPNRVA